MRSGGMDNPKKITLASKHFYLQIANFVTVYNLSSIDLLFKL